MTTDIAVVGAGCAGLTAALYIARAGKKVTVFEKESIGGQIASSPRVENYPGIKDISGAAFSDALCAQAESFSAEIECATASGVSPVQGGFAVHTEDGDVLCRAVILATGAKPRKLGLPNEEYLRGVSYCAVCDGAFYKGRDVAIVGGGSAALQSAEYLAGMCKSVTLIHRRAVFRGEQTLADRVLALPNVSFLPDTQVKALLGSDALTGVSIADNDGKTRELPVSGLFVLIGRAPDNGIFSPLVTLDERGYVLAGEDCVTSCPGIFAAGDCRVKSVRQLTTAAADGTVAAMNALNYIG